MSLPSQRTHLLELTRQKIFYFILLFALLLIGTSGFLAPLSFQQEFQLLKDVALGAMSIFISLLAIASTARLLSQEMEDRTIYTILAKPVSRFEYLLGKLAGVILLLALSLVFMSALFFAVLYLREQTVLRETARQISGLPAEQINDALRTMRASAFNASLLPAIVIIYFKGCLLASLTLFVSTFATLEYFHDRRHGFHLFHRTSAGDRAGILAATTQRRLAQARLPRFRCAGVSRTCRLSISSMTPWQASLFRPRFF